MMMRSPLVPVLVLLCATAVVAQLPIPSRGYGMSVSGSSASPVSLSIFMDLMCPYSAASWPTVQQVAEHYGPEKLQLQAFLYPRAESQWSFVADQGTFVMRTLAQDPSKAFMDYTNAAFANQGNFWNHLTWNSTGTDILYQFANLAPQHVEPDAFVQSIINYPTYNMCRYEGKYGCSRGVVSTPSFFVNEIMVNADPTWTLADWTQLLDPIVNPPPPGREKPMRASGSCANGTTPCVYLPGHMACCLPGEACIPNVGCRC